MKWDKTTQRQLEIEQIKRISILDYLSYFGYLPSSAKGNITWYLSPLRAENNPSFAVYTHKNDWFDFGANLGGSVIDLAMHLHGMAYPAAIKHLREIRTSFPCSPIHCSPSRVF
jgi:DNA primase